MPGEAVRIAGQILAYAAFAAVLGYLSNSPAYTHLEPGRALIRLSFSHAGAPVRECRRLTPEEIAELPPNMRRPTDCPRERVPLRVELELDGEVLFDGLQPPSGLAGDGASTVYRRFPVAAGRHRLSVRMRDSRRTEGWDWQRSAEIDLRPQENFAIDFRPAAGGFVFL